MLEMNIIGDNSSTIIRNANQNVETISHPFTFFSLPYFAFLITFFRDYCYEYWLTLVKWIKNGELEVDDLGLNGV